MVPEDMRRKRTKTIQALAPAGQAWCAGCQSFRDDADFGKGATTCRPCASGRQHATMVAKTYGLAPGDYDALLKAQGGRCAICRARPKSKRLAVDHNHKTGAVRGLLCSRCNHDLLGSAWDSLAMASALWHYMNTPPALGEWVAPENQATLVVESDAQRPSKPSAAGDGLVLIQGGKGRAVPDEPPAEVECARPHTIPTGAIQVPGKRGVWKVWVEEGSDPPF